MKIALAALGLTSTVAQVVLMRELVATFYGNELLLGLVLMAWLAWGAAGAWGGSRVLRSARLAALRAFDVGLALAGALFPLQIALVRGARTLLGVAPGALVEFGPMLGAIALISSPMCLLAGGLFTLGAQLIAERGGAASQAYTWESLGAVAGGALASFFFIRYLDPFQTALLVSALDLIVTLRLAWPRERMSRPLLSVSCLLLLAALFLGPAFHRATLRWQWPALVFAADSPYGRLTIQARDGQRAFFQNGLLVFETQGTAAEQAVHLPLLAQPDPRRVLLVGGGVAGDLREILKHPVAGVTYVELDPLLTRAAQAHLPPGDSAALADPRVELVFDDGRRYVQQVGTTSFGSSGPFDVVILDLPEPATGAINRFYTREFFAEVRAILKPGGLLAFGLPSAENYWSLELVRRNGSVYHALRAVFPETLVLPGERDLFLASDTPLEMDPAVLARRLSERGVETRQVTPGYITYVLTTDRLAQARQALEASRGVQLNQDLAPTCYYYDLALWLSRFYPHLRDLLQSAGLVSLGWVAVPLVLAVALARWRRGWAAPLAIACIGLSQMMLEVVILFGFQVRHGYVYAQVSLIVTAYMAGLAVGSALGGRAGRVGGWLSARQRLIAVEAAIVACSGGVLLVLLLPWGVPAVFLLLALLAGGLGGMAFPLALILVSQWPARPDAERHPESAGRAVGMLYGADLVGGCLGAALGAVLFVPVLGIPQTCTAIALVGLAGLLMLA